MAEEQGPQALVRYLLDDVQATVPLSHIKDFKKEKYVKGMKALVFWSEDPKITPRSLQLSQGIIKEIEKLPESKSRNGKAPLPGWYSAEILEVCESKEALLEKTSNSRVRSLSTKGSHALEQKLQQTSKKTGTKDEPYISKDKKKKMIKRSESMLADKWEETSKNSRKKQKRRKKYDSDSSASSEGIKSDDELVEKKRFKKRMSALEKENLRLKEDNFKLRELNYMWQKKALTPAEPDDCSDIVESRESVRKSLFSTDPFNNHVKVPSSVKQPIFNEVMTDDEHFTDDTASEERLEKTPSKEQPKISSPTFNVVASPAKLASDWEVSVSSVDSEQVSSAEKQNPKLQLNLTPSKLKKVMVGVKPKVAGDSLFAKNLAVAIFGSQLLMNSSVSGRRYTLDKNAQARPPLPQKGVEYLKDLYVKRMEAEIPPPDKYDIEKRTSAINKVLIEKIKDMRKTKLKSTSAAPTDSAR